MNKKQENQHSMQLNAEEVCNENETVCNTLPALAKAIVELKANNAKIMEVRVKQKTPTTGYTEKRDNVKKEMAESALEVAGSVAAFAHENNNDVLGKKVDFSYTELIYARDAVVKSRATIILKEATDVVSQLGDYGTDTALLKSLKLKIKEFAEIVGKKGFSKEETQTATEEVAELLSKNSKLLKNRIDKLVLKFKKSHSNFYSTYFNAREIYDFGGGKKGGAPEEAAPVV